MNVFVYGTLTEEPTASRILEEFEFRGPAVLSGLHRVDGQYPTLAPGGSVEGRLLWTPDVGSLDRYEGVDRGLYVRLPIPVANSQSTNTVDCYIGDPAKLNAQAAWPENGSFAESVRQYLRENDVVVQQQC